MTTRPCDIAIAGGGLAGGLIALAVQRARPELDVRLFEGGETLGGNHRWSWFDTDLDADGRALLAQFRTTQWPRGYDVVFPEYSRTLDACYNSLSSDDFDEALQRELNQGAIATGRQIVGVARDAITFENGEPVAARAVIDCRGFATSPYLTGGWQVFMGRHLRTATPHGLERPIIMDAAVEQHGAYRFVYTLPLGAHELFVEDTYYADAPTLDRSALSQRIDAYCAGHGWEGEILGGETGVLPVITGGNFAAHQAETRVDGVAQAGARGGFVHPLTSYTMPQAVRIAQLIAANADLPGDQLAALLEAEARRHWRATGFYRMLGAMLMRAADPGHRYRIFQRFYRLPEPLIERFYAARSTTADRARVLVGKPPVPITRALAALTTRGKPLTRDTVA